MQSDAWKCKLDQFSVARNSGSLPHEAALSPKGGFRTATGSSGIADDAAYR
jgi:hypothetical protein